MKCHRCILRATEKVDKTRNEYNKLALRSMIFGGSEQELHEFIDKKVSPKESEYFTAKKDLEGFYNRTNPCCEKCPYKE